MSLAPGTHLGPFEILAPIGAGGSCTPSFLRGAYAGKPAAIWRLLSSAGRLRSLQLSCIRWKYLIRRGSRVDERIWNALFNAIRMKSTITVESIIKKELDSGTLLLALLS
jgi:hypothetical protein